LLPYPCLGLWVFAVLQNRGFSDMGEFWYGAFLKCHGNIGIFEDLRLTARLRCKCFGKDRCGLLDALWHLGGTLVNEPTNA
jgi:hypothetical protein